MVQIGPVASTPRFSPKPQGCSRQLGHQEKKGVMAIPRAEEEGRGGCVLRLFISCYDTSGTVTLPLLLWVRNLSAWEARRLAGRLAKDTWLVTLELT